MTTDLKKASILYLDDQIEYIDDTRSMFNEYQFHLDTTMDIDYAYSRAVDNKIDIFICDLKLEYISDDERGDKLLLKIRNKNKRIFLVLYSAWLHDLSRSERKILEEQNIAIYEKNDNDAFIHNFPIDFSNFLKGLPPEELPETGLTDSELTADMIEGVIDILSSVTNQEAIVPVNKSEDLMVKDLIRELNNRTNLGRRFLKDWIQSDIVYRNLKE